ncbi:2OG-Fe(II) oxygenase [Idiomarina loihiensis]|jgi:SM-20-related protein|uniref:2OG-Fe(II) oxygenase n=1 Tax=Idiomarina rhizosphaerae TaxID=2961572 RepID=A0A9X2FVD0_9GAMM|nr:MULTISPECIES: 2OG-Fe(II) oxygenase [Idiomarina]MAA61264.1 proline hydroxylase [Idiomarina sp.]MCP1338094.1 2OG-Fe(II) oxygenase [Idiomarina rhizosphaerae]NWO01861.1 2OG-Fe(II) oxygenase [Idiomarinaceae bacterium]|tara:strand:- start:53916 stop:54533 length:618 start_codon:yes stop_codon:yes gene_type:complete
MVLSDIIDKVADHGYCIIDNFLQPQRSQALYQYAQQLPAQYWNLAGIGRQQNQTINTMVRNDRIYWLTPEEPRHKDYLSIMDELRHEFNRELFLGLFDYECHLAHYPKGAFYKKHLDAFKGRSNRVLTTVFYLNPEWQETDGGQLVIYGDKGQVLETVLPKQGRLVVFLSDRFVHEVQRSERDRFSITGWFRINASISGIIDPPR